jgi:hypothetical protein
MPGKMQILRQKVRIATAFSKNSNKKRRRRLRFARRNIEAQLQLGGSSNESIRRRTLLAKTLRKRSKSAFFTHL